jgi:TolC family type I secretion outer membrane protein
MKIFNKIIKKFLFIISFLSQILFAQDSLTIDQCIEIALKNNPQIKIAESNIQLSSANLKSSRSSIFPQVSLQSGWTKNGGNFFVGPTSREANYQNYSYGFNAQMLIFDFGKTYSRISAASDLNDASETDFVNAKQNLILDTYIAYFSYLAAQRIYKVSSQEVLQAKDHLNQAKAFYEVGRSPRFDVLKAQTDLENANVNLLNAENNIRISELQLENVLNTKLETFKLHDILEIKRDSIDENSAIATAINERPELISSKYRVDANKSLVASAWSANLPSINATGGYLWRSYDIDQRFLNSWNIGLNLVLPLFQGFAIDAGVEQAKANLSNSEAENDLTLQNVKLDVQQQFSNLQLAQSKITATKSLVNQSEETLKLAEGRYSQGVGSPIEITDARVALFNAQASYIQTLYDYQVAYVRLQKAMGVLQ